MSGEAELQWLECWLVLR